MSRPLENQLFYVGRISFAAIADTGNVCLPSCQCGLRSCSLKCKYYQCHMSWFNLGKLIHTTKVLLVGTCLLWVGLGHTSFWLLTMAADFRYISEEFTKASTKSLSLSFWVNILASKSHEQFYKSKSREGTSFLDLELKSSCALWVLNDSSRHFSSFLH